MNEEVRDSQERTLEKAEVIIDEVDVELMPMQFMVI
jgi:hypothetical protein